MKRYTFLFIVFLLSVGINISCVFATNTDQDMQANSSDDTKTGEAQLNDGLYASIITSKVRLLLRWSLKKPL